MQVEAPAAKARSLNGRVFGRLWRDYVRRHVPWLALAALCMALVAASVAASAYLMKDVLDGVFIARDPEVLRLVALAVVAIFTVRSLASYAQELILARVGQRIIADTQIALFHHLIRQDVAMLQERHSGTLVSRFTFDVSVMRDIVSTALIAIGRDLLTVVVLVGGMFWLDWRLALLTVVVAPICLYPVQVVARRMRKVASRMQEEMGALTRLLTQSFQGVRVIKAFGMEAHETARVTSQIDRVMRLNLRATAISAASQPIIDIFGGLATAAVLFYVGQRVIAGETTPGIFAAFMTAIASAFQPLRTLSRVVPSIQQGLAAAERLFELMDRAPLIQDPKDAPTLPRIAGAVRFEDVRFFYDEGQAALDGVSFEAAAGRVTALVGPSGAGKSTVFGLIPRFHDPAAGRVLVNDRDVRAVSQASLRAAIAVVSQDVTLFDDTLMNNIRYGRLDATDAEVRAAAKLAAADGFIEALPQGYDTWIGEQGAKLSGGQRQRVAIARAILKDAPILLLDEATSALDADSERQIQEALARLVRGRTTLVIAHRLSTIRDADRILVFDAGRIIETGDHDALIARGGLYARLHAPRADGARAAPPPARGAGG